MIFQFVYIIFVFLSGSYKKLRQKIVDNVNESCLLIMYYHLFTFGDSGLVNGTDNNVNS